MLGASVSITVAQLRHGGKIMVDWLTCIMNYTLRQKFVQEDWHKGVIMPLLKGRGNTHDSTNHRCIMLFLIPGKVFTCVLLNRALWYMRTTCHPQQASFMPNRLTINQISALWLLLEKHREFWKDYHLYIAFIDLKATFDSANWPSLWLILWLIGASHMIVDMLAKLYEV